MKLNVRETIDRGLVHYVGSLGDRNILLIIGRDNFEKDDDLIRRLIEFLSDKKYTIAWYENFSTATARLIKPNSKWATRLGQKKFLLNLLKGLKLLKYPNRWDHFLVGSAKRADAIPNRARDLRSFIRSLGEDKNIIIIARSAGGRVASLVEDEPTIKKIICLGYPFKHPAKPMEPERVRPLSSMKNPLLIVQGRNDEYGGEEVKSLYSFSSSVSMIFLDTDHDFDLNEVQLKEIVDKLKVFVGDI